jgi:hypothetical protein
MGRNGWGRKEAKSDPRERVSKGEIDWEGYFFLRIGSE